MLPSEHGLKQCFVVKDELMKRDEDKDTLLSFKNIEVQLQTHLVKTYIGLKITVTIC